MKSFSLTGAREPNCKSGEWIWSLVPGAVRFLWKNTDVLEKVHLDYIEAGSDIITANTYASSRIMLREAGYEDQFEEINRVAIETALRARDKSG